MATPAKLRDGTWGARVEGRAQEGDGIVIETKSGKKWAAWVKKVLWTDGTVSLCVTESCLTQRQQSARDDDGYRPVAGCAKCRSLGTMCRQCRFDEYDN